MSATQSIRVDMVAESAADAMFSAITSVDVDSRGQVYVGDWLVPTITVLGPDGTVVKTIGNSGEGPGEFVHVADVQVLDGDSLFVFDRELDRITVFTPGGGTVAYMLRLPASDLRFPITLRRLRRSPYLLASYAEAFTPSGSRKSDTNRDLVLSLLDLEGRIVRDSLVVLADIEHLVRRSWGVMSTVAHPFGARSFFDVGPSDMLYYGNTGTLGINVLPLHGGARRGFQIEHAPVKVTSQDRERELERLGAAFSRPLRRNSRTTWPACRGFAVDDAGRVWIAVTGPAGTTSRWEVRSPDGALVGVAHFPDDPTLFRVRGGMAYAVSEDESEVPKIVMYHITFPDD